MTALTLHRWTKSQLELVGTNVLLFQRDQAGAVIPESFLEGKVLELVSLKFEGGALVRILQVERDDEGTKHIRLFYIGTRKAYGEWKAPFTFFCGMEEEP